MRMLWVSMVAAAVAGGVVGCKGKQAPAEDPASTNPPPSDPSPPPKTAPTHHPHNPTAAATHTAHAPTSPPAPTAAPAPAPSGAAAAGTHHPGPGTPAAAPVLGEKIEIPVAHVQFNAPGQWKKNTTSNGWVLFKAPDNYARLGYVSFSQPGEATSRLGQLAEAFDLTNLVWTTPKEGFVGKDHFPVHEGDTSSCTLKNGEPCEMRYITVNPGGPWQIMVVYLVNIAHGEHQRSHAKASVESLRRL